MNFGLSQLGQKTPKLLLKLGHGLVGVSLAATVNLGINPGAFPKLSATIQIGGLIGYFLVNMFGEK